MRKLKFGETPFHKMIHKDLLHTCLRMYAALCAAKEAMENTRDGTLHPYYTEPRAVGGKAIELTRQVLEPIWQQYSDSGVMWEGKDKIHYNFYNYAMGLIFESKTNEGIELGLGWNVCLRCKAWSGINPWNPISPTSCPMCDGEIRPLNWDDMKPKQDLKASPDQ